MRIRIGKISPDVTEDEMLSSTVPDDKVKDLTTFTNCTDLILNNGLDNDAINARILHQWIEKNCLGQYVSNHDFWILLAVDHCIDYCRVRFSEAIYTRIRPTKTFMKRQALARLYWGADAVKLSYEDFSAKDKWAGVLSDSNLNAADPYRYCEVLFDLQDIYEATVGGRDFGRDKRMIVAILNGIETFNSKQTKKVIGEHVKRLGKKLVFLLSGRSLSALEWARLRFIIDRTLAKIDDEIRLEKRKNKTESGAVKGQGFIISSEKPVNSSENIGNVLRKKTEENTHVKKPTFIIKKKGE